MKIINKPWGKEEVIEMNEKYMVKKLTMWAGHRCGCNIIIKERDNLCSKGS